ncbi:YhbY family RNA-binding protein [Mollicutes bacterium LVI A0039]|nr:YhbY family RNA-binding protein [Mollicutes bacterium LVI A0039]
MELNSKQRATLKAASNRIKATFQIGAGELHENNIAAIAQTFNTKEIVKIKVNRQDKSDKQVTHDFAEELSKKTDSQVVAVIGTTIILYKQHKDKDMRMKI